MKEFLTSFSFGQPWWLLLLALVPLAAWLRGKSGHRAAVPYSEVGILGKIRVPIRRDPRAWLRYLGLVALGLAAVAMARPRRDVGYAPDRKSGVDIVFCVDVSGSMDTDGFMYKGRKVTDREALVMSIGQFVDHRPNDRFGMIGFAEHTYLMSPLTIDGEWIKDVLKEIHTKAWTAIGEGIVSSIELLKQSKSPSKVIIVASDGGNNFGISPLEAADMAKKENIRIHSVQFMPPERVSSRNATSLMGQLATKTGGLYFQAASVDNMLSIYREIDRMEKTNFEQNRPRLYQELFPFLLVPSGLLLLLIWIGGNTLWLRVP